MLSRIQERFHAWINELVAFRKSLGRSENKSPALGTCIPAADHGGERQLLNGPESGLSEAEYQELWKLAFQYRKVNRNDIAAKVFEVIIARSQDIQVLAGCYLNLGQIAEQNQDYEAALDYYDRGLALKPEDRFVAYFLNNNTGYCLNLFGKHADAERYCRRAIEIDSQRNNAFKNLGIALQGQRDLLGAAWAYMEATKADGDVRTMPFLADLISTYPELISNFPGILKELEACKQAVKADQLSITTSANDTYEICRLKYVPSMEFLERRDGVERDISVEDLCERYGGEALRLVRNNPGIWCAILREHNTKLSTGSRTEDTDERSNLESHADGLNWLRGFTPCLVLP